MLGWLTGRAWHATYAGVSCPFGPRPIGYNDAQLGLLYRLLFADNALRSRHARRNSLTFERGNR
jgi:hypothetical protein